MAPSENIFKAKGSDRMDSIIMNFGEGADINAVYGQLKKQYPALEMFKADVKEMLEDEYLLALAEERLKSSRLTFSHEAMLKMLGITRAELDNTEADEFE